MMCSSEQMSVSLLAASKSYNVTKVVLSSGAALVAVFAFIGYLVYK